MVLTLEQENAAYRERLAKLEGLVYVPGLWRCAKCEFQLTQMNLNANTGNVSARDEPGDKCPNCNSPLWRVTERDAGNQMCDRLEAEIVGRAAMLDHLETVADASEKRIADVYDLIYKTRELIRARLQPGSEEFRPEFRMLQDAIYGLGGRTSVVGSIHAARTAGPRSADGAANSGTGGQ